MSGTSADERRSEPRSAGIATTRRIPLAWPEDRDFRILATDSGGIRGLFPADVLAELEQRFLGGRSVAAFFDLIVGTSTGGIIALGLGSGLAASDLRNLYRDRGNEIFPTGGVGWLGRARRWVRARSRYLRYSYDSAALEKVLREVLGDKKLGESRSRLCVPPFEGEHGEVLIFKTSHHSDFKRICTSGWPRLRWQQPPPRPISGPTATADTPLLTAGFGRTIQR